jgi:BA14K-like protein
MIKGILIMKTLALAAFAAFAGFAAPATAQAQDLTIQDLTLYDQPEIMNAGGVFYDDDEGFRPRHYRPRHHQNGFSLEFQFGQPRYYYQPHHPRPRPVIRLTQAHVQWCYDRYRTYDHRSNSFVIRHGQRAYCVSPYSY